MATATEAPAATNANGADTTRFTAVDFPVDSFRDAALHLRRPFTSQAVKFKVQATWPKDAPTGGLIVGYIDARLVADRLNLVCPHLWHDEYEVIGSRMICRLTVDGITRLDIGEGYEGKGLYSDAIKRAAVKFGVGVSLYAIPKMQLSKGDGHLREITVKGGKKSLALTAAGEARCRELYAAWLEREGERAFGPALNHGDSEDAVGDAEAEAAAVTDEGGDAATIGTAIAKKMVDRVWELGPDVKSKLRLAVSHAAGGDDVGEIDTKAKATKAIAGLAFPQAEQLDRWISKKSEEAGNASK